MKTVIISFLLLFVFQSSVYSQDARNKILKKIKSDKATDFVQMKEDIKDALLNAESHTYPYNIVNEMIEFSDEDECSCAIFVKEETDSKSGLEDRSVVYSFHFGNLKGAEMKKIKEGNIVTLTFYKDGQAKADLIKGNDVDKTLEVEVLDIASSDLYSDQILDILLDLADYCEK